MVWEDIFKGFLLWLPWQPEFFIEQNYLKEFEGGPPKGHSCEIFLKEEFTDGRTDEQTDARQTQRHGNSSLAFDQWS